MPLGWGAALGGASTSFRSFSSDRRLSRGIRRPLNTIIGFADLIRSSAFGADQNQRYVEYARDIRTAGLEIAVLVDELDDFSRLRDGRYAPRPADVDLAALLESCMVRIKSQMSAGTAGRPTRRRDLQRQYRWKPLRCQRTSVSGLKTTAASSKEGKSR